VEKLALCHYSGMNSCAVLTHDYKNSIFICSNKDMKNGQNSADSGGFGLLRGNSTSSAMLFF